MQSTRVALASEGVGSIAYSSVYIVPGDMHYTIDDVETKENMPGVGPVYNSAR